MTALGKEDEIIERSQDSKTESTIEGASKKLLDVRDLTTFFFTVAEYFVSFLETSFL